MPSASPDAADGRRPRRQGTRSPLARSPLALRLTLGYAALFAASAVALFGLTFALLLGYLRERDRAYTRARLDDFAEAYARGGLAAVERAAAAIRGDDRGEETLVRVADRANRTLLLLPPEDWAAGDFAALEGPRWPAGAARRVVRSPRDAEVVEVLGYGFADGTALEVGMSSDERDDVAESFPDIFVVLSLPLLALALAGGAFMAGRAVRPVRRLAATLRSVIETGDVRERAPVPAAGGEIAELFHLFNRTFARIEALVGGLRGTLDDVAHDLRTPLTRLRGTAELALREGLGEAAYREALADVVEAAEAVGATLDAITDVAEAEAGAVPLRRARTPVAPLLSAVADLYGPVAEERGIALVAADAGALAVDADPAHLRRALANLVDNALKYTEPGGRVELGAAATGAEVALTVRDTGPGIPAGDLPRLWDRHFRGDRSRTTRGLGLGLSLVRALAEAHGGRVSVESVEGAGATFAIHLAASGAPPAAGPPRGLAAV